MFLHLNTDMENFSKRDNCLTWEIRNLTLPRDGMVALSSVTIDFEAVINTHVKISLNLIEQNSFNPDGTIICLPSPKGRDISKYLPVPEFWKLDLMFPRYVSFCLNGINIDFVNFAAFTVRIN